MNALRQIIKPNGRVIHFELPKDFELSEEIEITVSTIKKKKEKKVDLRRFKGAFAHLSEEKKQEAEDFFNQIRNEWE
jgi:hypothetical protein